MTEGTKTSQRISCIILSIITFICAAISFWYFDSYPELMAASTNIFRLWSLSLMTLTALMPFVSIAVFVAPVRVLIFARIHAAIYFSFITITVLISGSPGHSSPGSGFGVLIETAIYIIIFIELLLIELASQRGKRKGYFPTEWLFTLTSLAIIGGCSLGILIWSTLLPHKVITAAEEAAAGREYCFGASSKAELTGIKMYSRDYNGFTWSFHNLMVIKGDNGIFYMNWSYRHGKLI